MLVKWLEVQIKTTTENEDIVSDILYKYGATGLAIEDPNDILEFSNTQTDWDFIDAKLMDTGVEGILIKAYYTIETDILDTIELIKDEIERNLVANGDEPYGVISTYEVDDTDWSDNWKKHFATIKIGDKIIIKPTWEDYDETEGKIIIELDPGMAFGTGSHETTMMCAEALDKYVKEDSIVFDIGCGSGILSIVAAKLGAKNVIGIDLDEMCVKVSKENVVNNQVEDVVEIKSGNLLDVIKSKANLIVANIVAEIIVGMSDELNNYMEPNSIFICSGIIEEKIYLVEEALIKNGFKLIETNKNNGWACIIASNY